MAKRRKVSHMGGAHIKKVSKKRRHHKGGAKKTVVKA